MLFFAPPSSLKDDAALSLMSINGAHATITDAGGSVKGKPKIYKKPKNARLGDPHPEKGASSSSAEELLSADDSCAEEPLPMTVPTAQSIIDHFSNPEADGYEKWLLYSNKPGNKRMSRVDKRVRRLCQALGTSNEAATLEALFTIWPRLGVGVGRSNPVHGFEIPGTTLRVYKAFADEGYCSDVHYIAFGRSRPQLSVTETYIEGAKNWRRMGVVSGKRQRGQPMMALEEFDRVFKGIEEDAKEYLARLGLVCLQQPPCSGSGSFARCLFSARTFTDHSLPPATVAGIRLQMIP